MIQQLATSLHFKLSQNNSKLGRIGVLDPHLAEVTLFGLHWASYMSEVELNLIYAITQLHFCIHIKFIKIHGIKNQNSKKKKKESSFGCFYRMGLVSGSL